MSEPKRTPKSQEDLRIEATPEALARAVMRPLNPPPPKQQAKPLPRRAPRARKSPPPRQERQG